MAFVESVMTFAEKGAKAPVTIRRNVVQAILVLLAAAALNLDFAAWVQNVRIGVRADFLFQSWLSNSMVCELSFSDTY